MKSHSNQPTVGVIIPVCGVKYSPGFASVLASWRRQSLDSRVLVCEAIASGSKALFEDMGSALDVGYCSYPLAASEWFSVAKTRNRGALAIDTDYLYFSDADVVVLDPDFLQTLVELSEKTHPVMRPPMAHLVKRHVAPYVTWDNAMSGVRDPRAWAALCDFDGGRLVQSALACEQRIMLNETFLSYDGAAGIEVDGAEWAPDVHWGGGIVQSGPVSVRRGIL